MDIQDPRVVVTGNPVSGFKFYGPTPLEDSVDSYLEARTRRLEKVGTEWWLPELRPLSDLEPIDGDKSGPVYPRDVQRDALVQHVAQLGLDDGGLDDLVHDVASRKASDVNNSGAERQVAFLVDHLGVDGARALVDDLSLPSAP